MRHRQLPKLNHLDILLGRLHPKLIELRDSAHHGLHGELDITYKGFHISWCGDKLPKPAHAPFDREMI